MKSTSIKNKIFSEYFKIITKVMKNNKIDFDFQFRVRKYIEYIFREESDKKKEDKIFKKLSKPIKDEFFNQMYGKKLNSIAFFKQNFSADGLRAISTIMKKIE